MEKTFLEIIEDFLKQKRITDFGSIPINASMFPACFNETIDERIDTCFGSSSKRFDFYLLKFDKYGNLYLEITTTRHFTISILKNRTDYSKEVCGKKIPEDRILKDSEINENVYLAMQKKDFSSKKIKPLNERFVDLATEYCDYIWYLYGEHLNTFTSNKTKTL